MEYEIWNFLVRFVIFVLMITVAKELSLKLSRKMDEWLFERYEGAALYIRSFAFFFIIFAALILIESFPIVLLFSRYFG